MSDPSPDTLLADLAELIARCRGLPLPRLVEEGSPLGSALGELHATFTWIVLGLIGIHVLAALVHLVVYKDRVFYRMLPG